MIVSNRRASAISNLKAKHAHVEADFSKTGIDSFLKSGLILDPLRENLCMPS
jgi:hypothetical protein